MFPTSGLLWGGHTSTTHSDASDNFNIFQQTNLDEVREKPDDAGLLLTHPHSDPSSS